MEVEIFLGIKIALFEDPESIIRSWDSTRVIWGFWNLVQCPDTSRSDVLITCCEFTCSGDWKTRRIRNSKRSNGCIARSTLTGAYGDTTLLETSFSWREEFDTGTDIVDVLLDVFGDVVTVAISVTVQALIFEFVPLASRSNMAFSGMLIGMIFCM